MQSLKNGTQLGDYTLIRLIARGGMGEVYEAQEMQLQRRVALKIIAPLNPDEHDRDDLVRRFMQEARTLARVNHPNVVTIYAIESRGDTPFIAMEYVDGVSFRHLLHELTFTVDGALPLFMQMLEGLKSLHDNRIVHRDLKPHNILLRPDGQVKILDFGIAKHVGTSEHTRVGVIVGTLPYMAPELKNGAPASMRSDLWSLGAIFFECLTGKRLTECLMNGAIQYPAGSDIPPELQDILRKLCAQRLGERYLVAEQAIDELRQFLRKRPAVPASVMAALGKKVEAMVEAQRKTSEAAAAAPTSANVYMKTPAVSGDAPTRVATVKRPSRRSRRLKQNQRKAALLAIAGLSAVAILLSLTGRREPPKPALPTPVPLPVAAPPSPSPAPPPPSKPAPVSLREPTDQQILWLEPERIPTLSWSRALNPGEYEIQIASDAGFSRTVVQEPVAGTRFRPERVLAEGTYHWRLWPLTSDWPATPPSRFSIALLAPLELASPEPDFKFESRAPRTEIHFKWRCSAGASQYLAQLATDPEFNGLAQEKLVHECEWISGKLLPGTYHWRVRAADVPAAAQIWSQVRRFTLRVPPEAAPPALAAHPAPPPPPPTPAPSPVRRNPVPAVPALKSAATLTHTLKFSGKPRDVASLRQVLQEPPVLEWSASRDARKYQVQLSQTKDFSRIQAEETVTGPRFAWRGAVPGHFYWRVRAVAAGGEISDYSETGQVSVLMPAPQIKSVYKFVLDGTGTEAPTLEWPALPLIQRYIVQFGPRRDLAGAEERLIKTPEFSLPAAPAQYHVRVAAADEAGEALSPFSATATVEVESDFALEKPKPLSPPTGARAPSKNGRISVIFSWSKVSDAETYEFELASNPQFTQVIERRSVKSRGTLLQQAELRGRLYWRVRASSAVGKSDWSETANFEVK